MTLLDLLRRGRRTGLAGAVLFASLGSLARADGAAVWSMQGAHNTVYLAGSVHALPREHAELTPELELAYEASKSIVMEVDLADLDPAEAMNFVTSNGTLPEGKSLADIVGATKYAGIVKVANSLELPEPAISRLEPWAAAMLITQFALTRSGFDPQLGIDVQISERAQQDHKPVDGLETVIEQLGIFDSRSMDEQSKFLIDATRDVPKMHEDLDRLITAWRAGDLRALEREFNKERAEAPGLYDALLGARNRKWLPKIEALLEGDHDYLVVVGTLHFVGRDGLLELLTRDGHKPVPLAAPAGAAVR